MSSKLKWIAIAIVVVILILFVLPFLIPVDKFRPTIEEKASAALGRKVELGNLSLSIIRASVGIDNLSVSDDPKYNSGPFLTASSVRVGVELLPLIFSKKVNVTEIVIDKPQVTLLKDPSGRWNFSSIGGNAPAEPKKAEPGGSSSNAAESLSIGRLELKDGQITIGNTNSKKRSVYAPVDLKASNVSTTSQVPIVFSIGLPGGGTMKIDGKVGPVDAQDAAFTPQDVKLTISALDLGKTGFLDPSLGLGGTVDMNANLSSHNGEMSTKGSLKLSKAMLIAGGNPAGVPVVLDFDTKYDMAKGAGVLNPSTVSIGNAKSHLNGTYKSEGDEFAVDMKLTGEGLPATDLEAFLPALAVNLPQGTKLTAGTLNTNLHITGPTNKLVTDGNIGFFNGKLAGFDLGQKMSGVASLVGIKSGKDLDIEKMTTDVHMATTGLRADNFNLVVPALGSVVGGGTLDSKNTMDFKLVATVNSSMLGAAGGAEGGAIGGAAGKLLGGGASCKNGGIKVPLQIHGTTANPQFTPDIGGATASLMKSELTCAGGSVGSLAGLAGSAGGKGTTGVVNQLGGLFGGKKKP
ncbi:MAG TPA: AsmA family protein [Candidatus Dormibacteraeota bacterium]|nr:AsmA family protein [Candidatus Dormibacteraeota bacterium]